MARATTAVTPTGLASGMGATMLGGLAFIVPTLLAGVTPTQLTLGLYLAYGLASLGLLLLSTHRTPGRYNRRTWGGAALVFAVVANVGYYVFLVLGVQGAGASVTALIIGTLPVTVALYGNWRRREYPFARLAAPVALIFLGLLVINLAEPARSAGAHGAPAGRSILGLLYAGVALALWTWYAVANADSLRRHPHLAASTWATLTGVSTLLVALGALLLIAVGRALDIGAVAPPLPISRQTLLPFLAGSLALGLGASWSAGWLWNMASMRLPVSLAGQLIVCEPLMVLVYVFITGPSSPPWARLSASRSSSGASSGAST